LTCLALAMSSMPVCSATPPVEAPIDLSTLIRNTGSGSVSGFVVGSISYQDSAQLVPEFAGGVPTPADPGSANARFDKAGVLLTRVFSPWLSAGAAIEFESHKDRHSHGRDPAFGCPGATPCFETFGAEAAETELVLDKFHVTGVLPWGNGMALSLGRFDAPFGLERHDEVLLLTATTSDLFRYGRPNFLTGVRVAYVFSALVDTELFVANRWEAEVTHDDFNDNNAGKTLAARLGLTPIREKQLLNLGVGAVYGAEQTAEESPKRWIADIDATWSPDEDAFIALEALYGEEGSVSMRELGSPFARAAVTDARVKWWAASLLGHFDMGQQVGVSLRYGYFDDRDGARTGVPQTLQSVAVVPVWHLTRAVPQLAPTGQSYPRTRHPLDWVDLKLEYRYNFSDEPVFSDAEPGAASFILDAAKSGHQVQLQLAVRF
jgi:hypothetical protein